MNLRIKELMEQAKVTSVAIDPFNKTPYEYTHFSEEKFAELIVGECVEQVEQAKNDPFVSLDDAKRMAHFVDVTKKRIEKHFRS